MVVANEPLTLSVELVVELVGVESVEVLLVLVVSVVTSPCLRSISAGAAEIKVARKARKRRMATLKVDMERVIVTD